MSHKDRKYIGLLNDGLRSDWSFMSWQGMKAIAAAMDASFLFFDGNIINETFNYQYQNNLVYALANRPSCDALISWHGVIAHNMSPEDMVSFYKSRNCPVILVEASLKDHTCIQYGNAKGIALVMEHLRGVHGFTRIGYIGMYQGHPGFDQRYKGYREAMAKYGLDIHPLMDKPWWVAGTEQDNGLVHPHVFETWLRKALDAGMEALVCVTDSMAIQVLERMEIMGLQAPRDLAVTGFDGFENSQSVLPPLTTLKPDWKGIGEAAMGLALRAARGEASDQVPEIGLELMIGNSCGCRDAVLDQVDTTMEALDKGTLVDGLASLCPQPASRTRLQFVSEIPLLLESDEDDWAANGFLSRLGRELEDDEIHGRRVLDWNKTITYLDAGQGKNGPSPRAHRRLSKAYMMIGKQAQHSKLYLRYLDSRQLFFERFFTRQLVSTYDIKALGRLMEEHLPALGIPAAWIVLFNTLKDWHFPDAPPEKARLILAWDHEAEQPLPDTNLEFDTLEVLPQGYGFRTRPGAYIIQSLYFQDQQIGYIVYRSGTEDGWLYESISHQLSSMLQGSLLVSKINEQTQSLALQLEKLNTTQQQLLIKEKMAVLGSMVAGMSHELNTPLGVALTGATYLASQTKEVKADLDEGRISKKKLEDFMQDTVQVLDMLVGNLNRAAELIGSFKQVSSDQTHDPERTFDLHLCIQDTVRSLNPFLRTSALAIDIVCPPGIIIQGYPGVYSQILTNLIINTIRHAYPKGSSGTAHIAVTLEDQTICVSYQDYGKGLEPLELAHIFEPFRASLGNKGGSGLGTYLVYMLVCTKLGGTIQAFSQPGQGLEMRMKIPVIIPGQAPMQEV